MTRAVVRTGGPTLRDPALWLVVGSATALRVALAWRYFGFLGGDDVEILEEGFRRALGLAYSPWNVRNLLAPDLLAAPVLRLAALAGVHDVGTLALAAVLPFLVLASLNVVLVYRLAAALNANLAVARIAAALGAFHWLPLAFGSTVYPRTAAVTCILSAALLVSGRGREAARAATAGALVSVAFAIRYSEGVFLLPVVALAWASGRAPAESLRRGSAAVAGFLAGAALGAGAWDLATWGRPFASLAALARLTLVEHASSSRLPAQPALFYLQRLLFWVPATLIPVLPFAWRDRRVRRLWPFIVVPVLVLSLLSHKELRYLQGVVPFLAVLGAAGVVEARRRWPGWAVTALLVLALATEAFGVRVLRGKSMAAVTVARELAADPGVRVVALSQAWAYGDRLYFGNRVEVRDLPTPPTARQLAEASADADRIALYRKDLADAPALRAVLEAHGFRAEAPTVWGDSKAVVVFRRE